MAEFVLDRLLLKALRNRCSMNMVCRRCEKPFQVGDVVLSIAGKTHAKRYHKGCFDEMLY
jgi:hypothetical protein